MSDEIEKYQEKRELYYRFRSGNHYLSPEESAKLLEELDFLAKQIEETGGGGVG